MPLPKGPGERHALLQRAAALGYDYREGLLLVAGIVDEMAATFRRDFDAPTARLLAILSHEEIASLEPRQRGNSRGYFVTDLVPRAGLRGRGSIDRMKDSLRRRGILRPLGGRGNKRALWVFDRMALNRRLGTRRMYEDLLDAMGLWPKGEAKPRLDNPPPMSYDVRGETVWYGFDAKDPLRSLLEPFAEDLTERIVDVLAEGDYDSPGTALERTLHKFLMIDLNALILMRFPWGEWEDAYESTEARVEARGRALEVLRYHVLPQKLNLAWARGEEPDLLALIKDILKEYSMRAPLRK